MSYKNPKDPKTIAKAQLARRKHYQKNKKQYYVNNKLKITRMQEYVNHLKIVPCKDCNGLFRPVVMDFDHLDPTIKFMNIGRLVKYGSWDKLYKEIAKCEVVCSNCHRIRTENRRNS